MKRSIIPKLLSWLGEERRKPLIVRGARQVGKTWLVRALARERGLALLEVICLCGFVPEILRDLSD